MDNQALTALLNRISGVKPEDVEIKFRDGTPIGFIQSQAEQDKWENDVSLIHMVDGFTFRMVHHFKGYRNRRFYTVYAGRGKYVKVTDFSSDNDCAMNWIKIEGANGAHWGQSWGDGEPLGNKQDCEPFDEDLFKSMQINEDSDAILLMVLAHIQHRDELWQRKEVRVATNPRA